MDEFENAVVFLTTTILLQAFKVGPCIMCSRGPVEGRQHVIEASSSGPIICYCNDFLKLGLSVHSFVVAVGACPTKPSLSDYSLCMSFSFG